MIILNEFDLIKKSMRNLYLTDKFFCGNRNYYQIVDSLNSTTSTNRVILISIKENPVITT